MPQIFISYARIDEPFARQLAAALSDSGADVWLDVEDIPAGMKWSSAIQQGLKSSEILVVIISPESMASNNVEDEWQYFLDKKKPVIPLLLRQAEIHFQLSRLQYINFEGQPFDKAWEQLHAELRRNGLQLKPLPAPPEAVVKPAPPRPAAVNPAPSSSRPSPQRRNSRLWIGALLVSLIALAALVLALLNNRTQPPLDLTTTASASTVVATVPTNTPVPTSTDTPLPPGFTPITRNADWAPIAQDFDGVTMMLVPVGCFDMGNDPESYNHTTLGVPDGGQQCFDQPFWIDRTEVTQVDFERLGGQKVTPNFFDGDQHPVENITWFEARDFCAQRGMRLPTEHEWEYAARGPDNLIYPWGNEWNPANAVWGDNANNQNAAVGSRSAGASWVDVLDMVGNVWEWTSSQYWDYPYTLDDGREDDTGNDTEIPRVLRGGSWSDPEAYLRGSARLWVTAGFGDFFFGFRCARSS